MRIDELREWINQLPEKFDSYPVVIVDSVSEIENAPGKVLVKHISMDTCLIDLKSKEGCMFNHKVIDKYDKLTKGES